MDTLRLVEKPGTGHSKKQRDSLLLLVAILSSVLLTTSCSPKFVQVYPQSTPDDVVSISESLEQLETNGIIRYQVVGGTMTEAIYRERDSRAIYVTLFEWKKQLVGSKKVRSDTVTEIRIADLEQLHVGRRTTVQIVGGVAAVVVGVVAIYQMTTVQPE